MTEPEMPHNFTTSVVEALNDNRAALIAISIILVEKGICTVDEIMTVKAQVVARHDQQKAEADEVLREHFANGMPIAEFIRRLFS